MSDQKWWVKRSEEIWRQEEPSQGSVWSARFDGDAGDLWIVTVRPLGNTRSQEISLHWDFGLQRVASVKPEWPKQLLQPLIVTLTRRSAGLKGLTTPQQGLLNELAAQLHTQGATSGKRLRANLELEPDTFKRLFDSLAPRYVHEESDDRYTLTLPGLLACGQTGQVSRVLESVLSFFRTRFRQDPDFESYTWDELKTVPGMPDVPLPFVDKVISAARLHHGASGNGPPGLTRWQYTWKTPRDIEELSKLRNLDGFIAYIRGSDTGRPWPTAPVLLPEELEQLRRTTPFQPVGQEREAPRGHRIFVGHGRSRVWLDLKRFLVDTLGLEYDEFNRESAAGLTTTGRLEQMLQETGFAFIVMTAEDELADGSTRARQNVVHEAGLFQGRLGFKRAIILLEEGCEQFSNIHGLTYISFPKGNLRACTEEIRQVLVREGLLPRE